MAITGATLFGRTCRLEVGQPGAPARAWEGLRVTFTVERSGSREPNTAEIEVYGLTRDSSAACREKSAVVRLFAGYAAPGCIFSGGIDHAARSDNGRDAVTKIEAADGGEAFRGATIRKTFTGQTKARQLFGELANAAGLVAGFLDIPEDVPIVGGVSFSGPIRDGLDRLARMVQAEWSIQDGALQVLRPAQATSESTVLLSPETGLIGSPQPVADKESTGKIEVTALLLPTMKPGRRFQLESRDFSGVYKAEKVAHRGDTHGQDWYTTITARAV